MKHKRVPFSMTCPCCGEKRLADPYASPLRQESELAHRAGAIVWGEPGWSAELARLRHLVWACDDCLGRKRAVAAKPWLQTYCCQPPRFAYFDRAKSCTACGEPFVFSAREQRAWYEEYKLRVDAEPVSCLRCRRAKRRRVTAGAELGPALKGLDPRDPKQLVHIADLYMAIDCPGKAALFLRRAKNRLDNPQQIGRLLARIAEAEGDVGSPSPAAALESAPLA